MRIPGLKILDVYIIKKFLGTFFFAITLIIGISIVFDLSEKIDNFLRNEAPIRAIIFDYYVNFAPYFAMLFSNLFTFIAVIFFTSKMTVDSEIIAILSSGTSFHRLLRPYLISALFISLFSFGLTNFILPKSNAKRLAFEEQYYRHTPNRVFDRDIHIQIQPGLYVSMQRYNYGSNMGHKFSLEEFKDGKLVAKMYASYIKWLPEDEKWRIQKYEIRKLTDEGEVFEKGAFIDSVLYITPKDFTRRNNDSDAMTLSQLSDFIEVLEMQGSENVKEFKVRRYTRWANPFSTFILAVIGLSLSSQRKRGGMGLNIGIGLLLSFTFIVSEKLFSQFAIGGSIEPLLAVWLPNIIYTVIALYLYRRAPK